VVGDSPSTVKKVRPLLHCHEVIGNAASNRFIASYILTQSSAAAALSPSAAMTG